MQLASLAVKTRRQLRSRTIEAQVLMQRNFTQYFYNYCIGKKIQND